MNLDQFTNPSTPSAATAPKKSGGFKRKVATAEKGQVLGVNLVDYSQIVISTIMGTYSPKDELDIDLIRHVVLNTIRLNVQKNKRKYPHIVLCIDNATGGYWRKKVASYYKGRRTEGRDKNPYDFDMIFKGMETVKLEMIDNLPYVVLDEAGVEADDHIGVMTKHFTKKGVPVLITSSDGDFTQLQKFPGVKQWSPMQKKFVKPKHGSPERDILFKCFKGDKKDGIASMNAKPDHYMQTPIVRAPNIYEKDLVKWMDSTEAELIMTLTEEQYDRYLENRKLLDFECIPKEICDKILLGYKEYKVAPRARIFQYFASRGLKKLMNQVSDF